jgi:Flp pilus assembly protein CpaB
MAFEISPARSRHDHQHGELNSRDVGAELGALKAENDELRKVVIALSKLVVRNVLHNDTRSLENWPQGRP